ncbi:Flp family type IVb pilin [Ramlibacter sp. AN1015]|uniref:Flp family type IVb pilin n=1 Tax=Ramlibacter sp. AN1015 TaxID=3133428 RepID=UPI0030BA5B70
MNTLLDLSHSFVAEEDGAQIIEYGLILAVVSLVLIVLLAGVADAEFQQMADAVAACLSGADCTWGGGGGGGGEVQ